MTRRLRKHVIGVLAAATIAAAGLVATPAVSAMSMSCVTRIALATTYIGTGDAFFSVVNDSSASYWLEGGAPW